MAVPAKQDNAPKKIPVEQVEKGSGRIPKKGYYYKAGGDEPVASAWRVQEQANDFKISSELKEKTWNDEYIEVVARGHHPDGYYVDGIVLHEYKALQLKKVMEYFKRVIAGGNILFGAKGKKKKINVFNDIDNPFLPDKEGNMRPNLTGIGQAKLLDDMLDIRIFGIRDATTKAMRIVQEKLTNQEWRGPEEIKLEEGEVEQFSNDKKVEKVKQDKVDEEVAKKRKVEEKKQQARKKAEQKKSEDAKQKGKEANVDKKADEERAKKTVEEIEKKAKDKAEKENEKLKDKVKKDEEEVNKIKEEAKQDTDRIPMSEPDLSFEITKEMVADMEGADIIRRIITSIEFNKEEVTHKKVQARLMSMRKAKWVSGKTFMEGRKHLMSIDLGTGETPEKEEDN